MEMFLQKQYHMVTSSRAVVLAYIAQMSDQDFISSSPAFGRGSVRNLIVHICDTYLFWIADRTFKNTQTFPPYETYTSLQQCIAYFEEVDRFMEKFISTFGGDVLQEVAITRKGGIEYISPLQLFTHVITHEFHHKGQIMSLSRELGYIPVDADIIR